MAAAAANAITVAKRVGNDADADIGAGAGAVADVGADAGSSGAPSLEKRRVTAAWPSTHPVQSSSASSSRQKVRRTMDKGDTATELRAEEVARWKEDSLLLATSPCVAPQDFNVVPLSAVGTMASADYRCAVRDQEKLYATLKAGAKAAAKHLETLRTTLASKIEEEKPEALTSIAEAFNAEFAEILEAFMDMPERENPCESCIERFNDEKESCPQCDGDHYDGYGYGGRYRDRYERYSEPECNCDEGAEECDDVCQTYEGLTDFHDGGSMFTFLFAALDTIEVDAADVARWENSAARLLLLLRAIHDWVGTAWKDDGYSGGEDAQQMWLDREGTEEEFQSILKRLEEVGCACVVAAPVDEKGGCADSVKYLYAELMTAFNEARASVCSFLNQDAGLHGIAAGLKAANSTTKAIALSNVAGSADGDGGAIVDGGVDEPKVLLFARCAHLRRVGKPEEALALAKQTDFTFEVLRSLIASGNFVEAVPLAIKYRKDAATKAAESDVVMMSLDDGRSNGKGPAAQRTLPARTTKAARKCAPATGGILPRKSFTGVERTSTGGKAPRKQLAVKAARKSCKTITASIDPNAAYRPPPPPPPVSRHRPGRDAAGAADKDAKTLADMGDRSGEMGPAVWGQLVVDCAAARQTFTNANDQDGSLRAACTDLLLICADAAICIPTITISSNLEDSVYAEVLKAYAAYTKEFPDRTETEIRDAFFGANPSANWERSMAPSSTAGGGGGGGGAADTASSSATSVSVRVCTILVDSNKLYLDLCNNNGQYLQTLPLGAWMQAALATGFACRGEKKRRLPTRHELQLHNFHSESHATSQIASHGSRPYGNAVDAISIVGFAVRCYDTLVGANTMKASKQPAWLYEVARAAAGLAVSPQFESGPSMEEKVRRNLIKIASLHSTAFEKMASLLLKEAMDNILEPRAEQGLVLAFTRRARAKMQADAVRALIQIDGEASGLAAMARQGELAPDAAFVIADKMKQAGKADHGAKVVLNCLRAQATPAVLSNADLIGVGSKIAIHSSHVKASNPGNEGLPALLNLSTSDGWSVNHDIHRLAAVTIEVQLPVLPAGNMWNGSLQINLPPQSNEPSFNHGIASIQTVAVVPGLPSLPNQMWNANEVHQKANGRWQCLANGRELPANTKSVIIKVMPQHTYRTSSPKIRIRSLCMQSPPKPRHQMLQSAAMDPVECVRSLVAAAHSVRTNSKESTESAVDKNVLIVEIAELAVKIFLDACAKRQIANPTTTEILSLVKVAPSILKLLQAYLADTGKPQGLWVLPVIKAIANSLGRSATFTLTSGQTSSDASILATCVITERKDAPADLKEIILCIAELFPRDDPSNMFNLITGFNPAAKSDVVDAQIAMISKAPEAAAHIVASLVEECVRRTSHDIKFLEKVQSAVRGSGHVYASYASEISRTLLSQLKLSDNVQQYGRMYSLQTVTLEKYREAATSAMKDALQSPNADEDVKLVVDILLRTKIADKELSPLASNATAASEPQWDSIGRAINASIVGSKKGVADQIDMFSNLMELLFDHRSQAKRLENAFTGDGASVWTKVLASFNAQWKDAALIARATRRNFCGINHQKWHTMCHSCKAAGSRAVTLVAWLLLIADSLGRSDEAVALLTRELRKIPLATVRDCLRIEFQRPLASSSWRTKNGVPSSVLRPTVAFSGFQQRCVKMSRFEPVATRTSTPPVPTDPAALGAWLRSKLPATSGAAVEKWIAENYVEADVLRSLSATELRREVGLKADTVEGVATPAMIQTLLAVESLNAAAKSASPSSSSSLASGRHGGASSSSSSSSSGGGGAAASTAKAAMLDASKIPGQLHRLLTTASEQTLRLSNFATAVKHTALHNYTAAKDAELGFTQRQTLYIVTEGFAAKGSEHAKKGWLYAFHGSIAGKRGFIPPGFSEKAADETVEAQRQRKAVSFAEMATRQTSPNALYRWLMEFAGKNAKGRPNAGTLAVVSPVATSLQALGVSVGAFKRFTDDDIAMFVQCTTPLFVGYYDDEVRVALLGKMRALRNVLVHQCKQNPSAVVLLPPANDRAPTANFVVLGNTGAGKSTLLNAALGELEILPTNCMRACTAAVIELGYLKSAPAGVSYKASIDFVTATEFEKEVDQLIVLANGVPSGNPKQKAADDAVEAEARDALAKLKSIFGSGFACPKSGSPEVEELKKSRDGSRQYIGGDQVAFLEVDSSSMGAKLGEYVDSANDTASGAYWPLIKRVVLEGPWESCFGGRDCFIRLIDAPGLHDDNAARAEAINNVLAKTDGVVLVSNCNRAVNDKITKDAMPLSIRKALADSGTMGEMFFVATQVIRVTIHF